MKQPAVEPAEVDDVVAAAPSGSAPLTHRGLSIETTLGRSHSST